MKKLAPLFVFAAGVLWGMMGIFVHALNDAGLTSMDIVLVRSAAASLILFVWLAITDRGAFRIRPRDLWCFLGTGLCSILFFNACYFYAIRITSMAVAAVLLYTAPAIVMVLSAFLFAEKFTAQKTVSLVLVFFGCMLVTGLIGGGKAHIGMAGLLAGLGSGLGYAMYSIFGRYAIERKYSSLTITFYTFLIAGLGACALVSPVRVWNAATSSGSTIFYSLGLGLFSSVLPFLLYTAGLRNMDNGTASMIATAEPVAASIFGFLIFHESLTAFMVLGICLVVGGIVLCSRTPREKGAEERGKTDVGLVS